jgi:uncharacterized membrane protein YjgN (DUF898 family)
MALTNVAAPETAPLPVATFGTEVFGAADSRLVYDGRLGELAWLWLKTLLLSFITLGFYRFWGRTRIRKYLWSRVSLDGDRFEYDGTGGELFRRFLLALVVLAPALLLPGLLRLAGVATPIVDLVTSAISLGIGFLALVGYYAGRRYRLSRTVWRGIRGGLDGSAPRYALLTIWSWFLNLVTLGFYVPWQRVRLWRYEANNMRAGDARFAFEGKGRALLRSWLFAALVLVVATLSFGAVVVWGVFIALEHAQPLLQFAPLAFIFLMFMLWPVFVAGFTARWWSYMASNTRLLDIQLAARIGAWRLIRLQFGNILVLYLTLGLGWPFVGHRMLKFWSAHLRMSGIESLAHLTQETPPPKSGAEGLSQLFGEGGFA